MILLAYRFIKEVLDRIESHHSNLQINSTPVPPNTYL